jgi:hypothetical protein
VRCDLHFRDSQTLDSLVEILPIDLVSISKQVTPYRILALKKNGTAAL